MAPSAEEILGQQGEAYRTAKSFNQWQPPVGNYISLLESVESRAWTKEGKEHAAVALEGKIVDGGGDETLEGREHSLGFFGVEGFGRLKDVVLALGEDPGDSALDAMSALKTKVGTPLQITIAPNPKGGRPFVNIVGEAPTVSD